VTEKVRQRKFTLNLVQRFVIAGLITYLIMYLVILVAISNFVGILWGYTIPGLTPELVDRLRTNSQILVSLLFVIALPLWIWASAVYSRQLLSRIIDLISTPDQFEEISTPATIDLDSQDEFTSTEEIGQVKRMLTSMMGQIRQADVQYRSIVANQSDLIHRWTLDGEFTFVNQAFCDFFGLPEDFWLNTPPEELKNGLYDLYPDLSNNFNLAVLNRLTPESPEINSETEITMPNGDVEWIQWHTLAMFDRDGDIVELQSIGHVVTDLKQTQLELERLNLQLTQLSQELIQGQEAERASLARFLHDEVLGELGEIVRNPSDHAVDTSVIQKIIELVRSRIYMMRSPMLEYGLSMALEDLADTHREIASGEAGFEFSYELEASPVRFNPEVETQIFRIVQQACKNAVDHSQASLIICKGEIRDGLIDITVEDDGIGFDYESEVRGSLALKKHYGMIGMEERCRIIGAKLDIFSAPGKGTRVRVHWETENGSQPSIPSEKAQRLYQEPERYNPPLK